MKEKENILFNGIFVKRKRNDPDLWPKYYGFYCFEEKRNKQESKEKLDKRIKIVDIFGTAYIDNLIITPDEITFRKTYIENKANIKTKTIIACHLEKNNAYPNFYAGNWKTETGIKPIKEKIIIHRQNSKDSIRRLHVINETAKYIFHGDFNNNFNIANIAKPRI